MNTKNDRGIFERPVGSGVWWVRYADEHGKLRRIKVGKYNTALAVYNRKKEAARLARLLPPPIPPPPVPTPRIVPTVDEYIETVLERTKGMLRSWVEYKRAGDLWKAAFGSRRLDTITPGDIEQWRAAHRDDWKPATMNRHLAFLRRVFYLAIGDGHVATSPFQAGTASVKLTKENNERIRFLTFEEENKLRAKLAPRAWLAVEFAIRTGLRQGEQFTARWEHVDFETQTLTVPRSKHGEKRHLPLSPEVIELLYKLKECAGASPWVFPSATGVTHMDTQNFVNRVFKKAVKDAEITDFKWHDLRHTFCSRLAMAGVPLYSIARLAGHKSDRMTQRYTHLDASHLRAAVARVSVSIPPTGDDAAATAATDTTVDTSTSPSTVH